jgi:predicted PurR-regulated permease PerM
MSDAPRNDLTRITLAVLFIGGLIIGAFWVLRPFVAATIWATMIAVTTWPMLLWFQHRLWGSRGLAVTVMTLLLLLLLVAPLTLAIGTIVTHADDIIVQATALSGRDLPPPPAWVENLPLVGAKVKQFWDQAVESGARGLVGRLAPYADDIVKWFVAQAGSVGFVFVQFLLTALIAALMWAGGDGAAGVLRRFAVRLGGAQGDAVITLGGQAIRAVALGVGVTAVVQSAFGGIGLAIAGVPFAGLLTAVMLLLCIAQLGPSLVLFPVVAWMFWKADTGWAIFLLAWTLVAVTMDNFIRPWLIKRGADMPLLLIFAGVIGGLLAFGLIGLFVGPVVLAVAYTLLGNWIDAGPQAPARAPQ